MFFAKRHREVLAASFFHCIYRGKETNALVAKFNSANVGSILKTQINLLYQRLNDIKRAQIEIDVFIYQGLQH